MSIKRTIRKEMKEIEVIEVIQYFCDLCKIEIKRDTFSRNSFRIKFSRGYGYPEGGSIDTRQAYFCEDCSEKILGILEALGVVFEDVERSW